MDPHLRWWTDARFGMFVHWGPVSLAGTEIGWSRGGERRGYPFGNGTEVPVATYDNLYKRFDPVQFDADRWVQIAKATGMRYLVFTARHHDGFSMFDSRYSDYKITSPESPFRRDVVKELADACHRGGLRFGIYYSQPDWHSPDAFTSNHERYKQYLRDQLRELLTNYGKVDVLWFDGLGKGDEDYGATGLLHLARELQPGIIINDRSGAGGDYATPEQTIGGFDVDHPWETCMTLCNQWAWKPNDEMKSLKTCVQTLVRCAGGDGNLLFNVGPMPTGEIEPRQVKRLGEIGAWLRGYGETIYGTRGGPYKPTAGLASTRRGNVIYVHSLNGSAEVDLPLPSTRVLEVRALTGGNVSWKAEQGRMSLKFSRIDPLDTIAEVKCAGSTLDLDPIDASFNLDSVAQGRPAEASNVYQRDAGFGAGKAFDGDPKTRWATDEGTHRAWLSVDLGGPTTFDTVFIDEAYPGRIQSFELQAMDNGRWKTFYRGRTLGEGWVHRFNLVTANQVRLNILRATEGPTINEFKIGRLPAG